ncbi:ladderlectin-like isoform X2 [Anabas testudineus]|uniref:ladderlectin-like isoform X2 n=1 Tax=Anabas testudineus TaxID=64144 RepID=UPI000E45CDA1|nr:ladderlectin-like isoform X2 [Anabas testudineus]
MATALLVSVLLCFALTVAAEDPMTQTAEMFKEDNFTESTNKTTLDTTERNSWSDWVQRDSRFFLFVNRQMKWIDAERYCQASKANLVSIHSPAEYAFIQELIKNQTGTNTYAWIGGTDAIEDTQWFWSDGSIYFYQDWARGEPNNYGGPESCIVINFKDNYLWNDLKCVNELPFVCGTRPVGPC